MMKNNWFENNKKSLFKDNKKKKSKLTDDFTPERAMKLTGATVITAGGIIAGTKLIEGIGDA